MKSVCVIERHRPEGAYWWRLAFVEVKGVLVRTIERLARLIGTLFGPAQVAARVFERAFGGRYHPFWTSDHRLIGNVGWVEPSNRWGNRPAFLWIAEEIGAALQADGETRSPWLGPQASEGEAQHGAFCWTGRIGQADEPLHCG